MKVTKGGRVPAIDIARGIALIAMTIYHFSWDLELFGWLARGTLFQTQWVLFARVIATTFLFLAGVSLVLAHAEGIRWRPFWKRFAMVAAAAALISVATWLAFPDTFIFFGILHAIALFSLIGLAFLALPWQVTALAALLILGLGEPLRSAAFDHPALWWIGLAPTDPPSNDYVPLFPWLSATLLGIAAGHLGNRRGWLVRLRGKGDGERLDQTLGFLGRNSLVYYLLHQPVLIALVWAVTTIAPPDRTTEFLSGCVASCTENADPLYCEAFCACTADGLKQAELFTPFFAGQIDLGTNAQAQDIIEQCSDRQD